MVDKAKMPISDKARKILWGRSGNRCVICRRELVVNPTAVDDESVVGEECHIVSERPQGPRYDASIPVHRIDDHENLLLLCRIHHKMVDDQEETYTAQVLHRLKKEHENWVSSTLTQEQTPSQVRIRRIVGSTPSHLVRLTSGTDLMSIVAGSMAYSFDHDEPQSEAEVELLSSFLQEAQDWGELSDDLEAGGRVTAAFRMTTLIRELEQAGFWVFGERETQRVEGGFGPPSPFPVAILRVHRSTNPEIVRVNLQRKTNQSDGGPDPDTQEGRSG